MVIRTDRFSITSTHHHLFLLQSLELLGSDHALRDQNGHGTAGIECELERCLNSFTDLTGMVHRAHGLLVCE